MPSSSGYDNWDVSRQGSAVARGHNPTLERRQPECQLSERDDIHADEMMAARAGGGGASPWGNKQQLGQRVGTNGGHSASYGNRGSPSMPSSFTANNGSAPERHDDQLDRLANPPPPGQHPSFDSKVAAEFLRLRDAKGEGERGTGGSEQKLQQLLGAGPTARATGLGPPPAFESDVEQAMRDMEHELVGTAGGGATSVNPALRNGPSPGRGWGQGSNGGRTDAALGTMGSFSMPAGRRSNIPAPPPPPVARPGAELNDGILSQMEMHRVPPGGGKGKPGGLKDLWGGSEGYASKEQQLQRGGSFASIYPDRRDGRDGGMPVGQGYSHAPRRGPGLKSMWGGDDSASSGTPRRPQRQGPGLRGLWSGPDMVAADVARTEAQAAYLSALDRDVQERRAFSDEPLKMHQFRDRHAERGPPYGGQQGGNGGGGSSSSEYGTSLAGIGVDSGSAAPTPRRASHQRRESDGSGSYQDRAAEKARKAAYAEELRKQIAEKELRTAATAAENASKGNHRRASTGGWGGRDLDEPAAPPQPSGGEGQPYQRETETDAGQFESNSFPIRYRDGSHESPTASTERDRDGFPTKRLARPSGSSTQPLSALVGPGNGETHVTTARRRLVEDVYGGSGMGAALSGSGYRRSSTGSYGSGGGGPSAEVAGVGPVAGGDPATTLAANGTSHLRTGAGVQSLNESEHDSKWQKRAAALEQQRALQEQISAKTRAKKEEEEKRKREEEEEARQQRERLRQMEAATEEEKRRKQAEQQEQLDGLYRQQEEAIRKKRGGAGVSRDGLDGRLRGSDDREESRAPPYDMPTLGNDTGHPLGIGVSPRKSQAQPRVAADMDVVGGATYQTPRRRTTVPDVDDLPAGAQARAQVIRNSPPAAGGASASNPLRRPGSASSNPRSISRGSTPQERRWGSPTSNGRFDHGAGLEISAALAAEEKARTSHNSRHGSMAGRIADGGAGFRGGARRSPNPPATPAGQESRRPSEGGDEPPLRTHSALVPVSSGTLFPSNLAGEEGVGRYVEGMPSFAPPTQAGKAGGLKRSPGVNGSSAPAGLIGRTDERDAGGAVQDEMDAFVASWQTEHLRRRRQEGAILDAPSPQQRASPGGRRTSDGYPGSSGPNALMSPSRDLLRSSSARVANNRGNGAGRAQDLEASLVATSRMIGPSPPLPPSAIETAAARGGVGGQGWRTQRQTGVGGGADPSEQSLVSDSVLFYLTGEQRERVKPSGPSPTRAGSWTNRAESVNGSTADGREDLGRAQAWREGQGERNGGSSSLAASLLSPGQAAANHGVDDPGQMSPLTRLLAETPVRLASGDRLPNRGVDPGRSASPDADFPRRAGDGSRGGADNVARARRARALWGVSAEGESTVAEALTRRGDGTPWEEMSELRVSSSRDP